MVCQNVLHLVPAQFGVCIVGVVIWYCHEHESTKQYHVCVPLFRDVDFPIITGEILPFVFGYCLFRALKCDFNLSIAHTSAVYIEVGGFFITHSKRAFATDILPSFTIIF